jgi:hypothetical protein
MLKFYSLLFFIASFSLSCKHEKVIEDPVVDPTIDHIRWGSKNNPLDSLTISWRSNGDSAKIKWGYTAELEKGEFTAKTDSDYVGGSKKHEYLFDALTASSVLFYSLYDSKNDSWTSRKTFKTSADPKGSHFKFSAGGDSRTIVEDWHRVSEAIEICDFSLFLGDVCANGNLASDWNSWYSHGVSFISRNLAYHVRGSHDVGDIYSNNLVNPGNGRYYSFVFGNSVFIALDVPASETWAEQALFLQEVLKANQDKTWKFVFFHSPFFTSQVHEGEMDALRPVWWKMFDDYGVDFVFNGHEHSYMRSTPINLNNSDTSAMQEYGSGPNQGRCQIIAGQYGAPAYGLNEGWFVDTAFVRLHYTTVEVNDNTLEFKAIDAITEKVFDSLTLIK